MAGILSKSNLLEMEREMSKLKFKKRRSYDRREGPEKIFTQMTRDHVDVLQNIEFSIVRTCKRDGEIDDKIIASALKSAIADSEPAGELAGMVVEGLGQLREKRSDVEGNVWTKGLKVVLESVHTHSELRPGDKDYLDFIRNFVA